MSKDFKMVATTMFGLEGVLADELRKLGAQGVKEGVRNVSFRGDKGFLYKANIALRTAIRILKPIKTCKIFDEEDLYEAIQKIKWEKYLDAEGTFSIGAVVNSKNFTSNSHYISLKSKDAIADYFRHKYSKRPNVDLKYPDVKVHIHIQKEWLTISLDSSGDSLHKRGYRSATNIAPINEALAAGLVLLSGYTGEENFIDPMCGSGTILIEAAMIANNIPANINRKHFAFENWKDYEEDLYFIIQDALLKKIKNSHFKIMGFDKAPSAVAKAKQNIINANLEEFIGVHHVNFFNSKKEVFGNTTILFNPPYGERLNIDVAEFYRKIGDTLKNNYPNSTTWLITSDIQALKHVGLRTSRRIPLKNADLDCRFVRYDIYEGSRKASKIKQDF
ncbi:THUMP domain-containing class I SAM-dependent RNA methyltransferase [Tenacibaculum maritimum]|uniref:THUMP domain-containing protein n=1 Tax=Tenacibaculum maritimum NCIMB 2154 TaxID=1349785 RepID=A0A2H1EA63_9FLAO|nr:class I SAM-dependent RNA methyltransferase [Tenacibaculum maritimum]MCD9562661.1 class I SAM-dependent RNA methyltransferase [Tenacibaculum maritimum]MCD9565923.1 class I SAM-dependent RNA methyltransferase [Tenacibaculum maritimum]MCD9578747.1 class I SAM-dependent RNA methyltransferase [Tenacibaculum maritimum]MCD9584520.1 class I SAM-dependent RNA methyltransferase [Tenacibaculum maritimum]MCD9597480.1 class I SAM-dependent RNA methyltransferase [Tenacibaculum maritimum]